MIAALRFATDPFRIDVRAAIDCSVHPWHRELALVVNRHLDDGRDVADERAVQDRDAETVAFRHGAPQPPLSATSSTRSLRRRACSDSCHRARRSSTGPSRTTGWTIRGLPINSSSILVAVGRMRISPDHGLHREGPRMFDTERNQLMRVNAGRFRIRTVRWQSGTACRPVPCRAQLGSHAWCQR